MNSFIKFIIAIMAAMNVVITILTPLFLVVIWVILNGMTSWMSYLFYAVGLIASLFRAVKIGWLNNG